MPTLGVYLLSKPTGAFAWESDWIRWPDFRLPIDRNVACISLRAAWDASAEGRIEIVCGGGRGRTGTALACLAVIDGVPATQAVAFVRTHYHPKAVETPWQRRYVESFVQKSQ